MADLASIVRELEADDGETEPLFYGWRNIAAPDDEPILVPLTEEDRLHPQMGDEATYSSLHQRALTYLLNVIGALIVGDPRATVYSDLMIVWDVPGIKQHGPDIMVIFDVAERGVRSVFDVGSERTRPALIIEITSPETRRLDRVVKVDHYARVGVPQYVIIDLWKRRSGITPLLLDYRLGLDGYEPLALDDGRAWIESLAIWLWLDAEGMAVCADADGRVFDDYAAVFAGRVEADAAAQRATARAEAERRAAVSATAHAEVERRAALSATARAEAAERRAAELEAELRRLRGEG